MKLSELAERFTEQNVFMVFLNDYLIWEGVPGLVKHTEYANYRVSYIHISLNGKGVVIDIEEDMKGVE